MRGFICVLVAALAGMGCNPSSSGSSGSSGGGEPVCGEACCVPVTGAKNGSHFTGLNCTGTESYYTPYDSSGTDPNPDGLIYSWDGKGLAGTIYRTVTNTSFRHTDGTCTNDWPDGNTLDNFVTIYRSSEPPATVGSSTGSCPAAGSTGSTTSSSTASSTSTSSTSTAGSTASTTSTGTSTASSSSTGSSGSTASSSTASSTSTSSTGTAGSTASTTSTGTSSSSSGSSGSTGSSGSSGSTGTCPTGQFSGSSPAGIACGEACCVLVSGAINGSHFTGLDCTGTESYYTPYGSGTSDPNPDGLIYSWDGNGVAGTVYRTETNISFKATDGSCTNYWPSGNTLDNFVTIYR